MEWQAEVIITLKIIFQKRPEYYKIMDTKTEYYKLHTVPSQILKTYISRRLPCISWNTYQILYIT